MKLLEELTQTPSVPGREKRVRNVILRRLKGLVDSWRVDAMGNLIAVKKPTQKSKKPVKVMLAAHMDQIGFLVSHIDDKGHLRLNAVGGFDTRNLFARRVIVCTSGGDLPGVMNPGGKPIHIASEEEKKKIPDVSDFFVDMGLPADQVKSRVKLGDMVVLHGPFGQVGDNVVSQCLDNRAGCWAVIKTLQSLRSHRCEIHAVFTVQEEVGLRGAGPAAFGVDPEIGVSCDTTLCCQTPGVPEEQRVTQLGAGVCLKIMDSSTIADLGLIEDVEHIAAKHKIKCQRGILARGGQDGAMIQRSRLGVRTVVFACPVKYIHTVTETSSRADLESYHKLMTAWLATL